MKIGDYEFTAYKIKHLEAALRQIDRVWEKNKDLMTSRWLEKITVRGRAPINKTVKGLQSDFRREVLKKMSVEFGGKNVLESDVDVNTAIARVLGSTTFASKEMALKIAKLGRVNGSPEFRRLQRLDPTITYQDLIENGRYAKKLGTYAEGLSDGFGEYSLDDVFDETYNTAFEYTAPSGHTYIITQASSDSPMRFLQIR